MKSLMSVKLALKKFAGKNEAFLVPILKFLLTFLALHRINKELGFMPRLASAPITLIIALAGSFLPLNLTIVIIGFIIIGHMYYLSLECAIVVFALFLVLYLLYFRFASKDSIAGILTPLSFVWHVPYVMPVSMGLVGTPSSMVSVGCGVIIYQVLHYIAGNAEELSSGTDASKLGQFKMIIDAILSNKAMIVYAAAFAATVLVVYLIRRLPIKYCWLIAIGVGELTLLFVTVIGNAALSAGISVGGLLVGIIVSAILNVILQYFLFDLNYNRIERVQFEDDEYYYYVKAVPKNDFVENESKPKKKTVRRIPAEAVRRQEQPVREKEAGSARPVREDKERPVRPVQREMGRSQVERTAAAVRNANASKGPLGLSGGRPAGEGRRRMEQRAAEHNNVNNQ